MNAAVIDSGKRIYFLAFGNNCLVVDKGNLPLHEKTVIKAKYQLKSYESQHEEIIGSLKESKFYNERIVVVDNE